VPGKSPDTAVLTRAQWPAARRVAQSGAQVEPWCAAALGLMPHVVERMEANPPPTSEDVGIRAAEVDGD
jgi:hypothetical protein